MNKLMVCGFAAMALTASVAVASPTVVDLTALARTEKKGGTTSASSVNVRGPNGAFDGGLSGNSASVWRSDGVGEQWIQYQFNNAFHADETVQVLAYGLYYHQDYQGKLSAPTTCQMPRTWTFQGSDDGEAWTVLDTREDFTDWTSGAYRYFPCGAASAYRYYRLVITSAYGASATSYSITEMALMGCIHANAEEMSSYKYWAGREGDWNEASNWSPAGVPTAEDEVVVGTAAKVSLTNETASVASLTLGGRVSLSGADACLRGKDIAINAVGVLTCENATVNNDDYNDQTINRVYVSCGTLTVDKSGSITAAGKGWLANPTAFHNAGYGPGKPAGGSGNSWLAGGPSHGGHGAVNYTPNSTGRRTPLPYGDAAQPTTPGTSGAGSTWGKGGNGGGIVRIVATGAVTVNGMVTAAGADHESADGEPGSGGSVWISCQKIAGSGTVSAKGGNGYNLTHGSNRIVLPAGGGRIAIDYDAAAQAAADVTGLTVTAEAGNYSGHRAHADLEAYARYRTPGQGTLHFTDATLVDRLIGKGLNGDVRGLADYTHDGDLDFTYGHVRFGDEGVKVRVKGDLTLSGTDARLDIGGFTNDNHWVGAQYSAGTNASSLTVDGNLTLTGIACLDILAAGLKDDPVGATVTVGGTLAVGSNCYVYARSDWKAPSSPKFTVGSLTVEEGGTFSAYAVGGRGGFNGWSGYYAGLKGISQGSPVYYSYCGGSHGGQGAYGTLEGKYRSYAYDDAFRPVYPGSGGGNANNTWKTGGNGGGVIAVAATAGTIRIDGKVTADGEAGTIMSKQNGGGGAGGTILLEAAKFVCSATGVLTAKGGASSTADTTASDKVYCGGGGCISIFVGQPYSASLPKGRITTAEGPFAATDYPGVFECPPDCISVAGGQPLGSRAETLGFAGDPGTVRCTYVAEAPGLLLLVR